MTNKPRRLILASASPRREQLLRELGWRFTVIVPPDVAERLAGAPPAVLAVDNARRKAAAVAALDPEAMVLGADTIVVLDGEVFGKPRDVAEARAMLGRLAGRRHEVVTGVCVIQRARKVNVTFAETTQVWMRALTPAEIRDYVRTTRPLDKAGAYAIQAPGPGVVERIDGSYRNVMGLPVETLQATLALLDRQGGRAGR